MSVPPLFAAAKTKGNGEFTFGDKEPKTYTAHTHADGTVTVTNKNNGDVTRYENNGNKVTRYNPKTVRGGRRLRRKTNRRKRHRKTVTNP
jgi:hypothetical protein